MSTWKKVKFLKKGVSHTNNGTNCQDSVLVYENENYLIASLADGLGSLKYSEIAAQTATEAIYNCFVKANVLQMNFESKNDFAKYVLDFVVKKVHENAKKLSVSLKEMDCTLLFVCILKQENRAIVGRLGDSVVCIISESESIAINDGNVSANGTNAILDRDALDHFDLKIYDLDKNNIDGFILSSDGLENELYLKGSNHVCKVAEYYFNSLNNSKNPQVEIERRISQLTDFENTPFDDDISIVVLSRADKEITLPEDPTWLCTCGNRNHIQSTYCQNCFKDFSRLYQNIHFKDYGGKIKFFTEINKYPEREVSIIGLKNTVSKVSMVDSDNNQKAVENHEDVETDLKRKKVGKKNMKKTVILLIITFVLGLCLGGFIVKRVTSPKMDKLSATVNELQDTVSQYKQLLDEKELELENVVPENFVKLENDSYYWGNLDESGLPHEFGILLEEDCYFLGNFDHGDKNGDFIVINKDGEKSESQYARNQVIDEIEEDNISELEF